MASGNTGPQFKMEKAKASLSLADLTRAVLHKIGTPSCNNHNPFGDHGQSQGMPCSMLCRLVAHLSCSKPNHQLHTPCAGALHCVSARATLLLVSKWTKALCALILAACTLWYATVGSVFASITPKSALSDMSVTEPDMRGCFPKTH